MDTSKLSEQRVRIHRALVYLVLLFVFTSACSTLPDVEHSWHKFPKNAYIKNPPFQYEVLGEVKSKVDFPTLDANHDEEKLCENYFHKGISNLIRDAKKVGGDAVVGVRSVVFYLDGTSQNFERAECADDGNLGQVLVHGVAVRKKLPKRSLE